MTGAAFTERLSGRCSCHCVAWKQEVWSYQNERQSLCQPQLMVVSELSALSVKSGGVKQVLKKRNVT